MAQLTYNWTQGAAFAGMKADLEHGYTSSKVNSEATAEVPFGVMVSRGANDDAAILPATATDKFLGVVLHSHTYAPTQLGTVGVKPNNTLSVLERGTVWVAVEEAVNAGDRAFVRYAAGAGGTQKGSFRKSADTATAVELLGARYKTSAATGGMAILEIDANIIRSNQ